MHSHKRCQSTTVGTPTTSHSHSSKRSISSGSSFQAMRPHSVQRLEQLTLEVDASLQQRSDVRYVLRVQHRATQTRWSFSRSFDEYRSFKTRLLDVLQQGHSCHAECPWLYSFIAGYFPKSSMFRSTSASVVKHRQESLAKIITQLHSFLLRSANHSCRVTVAVADLLAAFVGADLIDQIPVEKHGETGSRASTDSLLSTVSTDEESEEDVHCPLCNESFVGETDCCYTTVLGCGHEFHEECILSKLNESMNCPVCGHAEQ